MYKNILILGSKKSGKSTLARKISDEYGYSIINLDNIIEVFDKTFPKGDNNDIYNEYITSFISAYIDKLSSDKNYYTGKKYVIEGNVPNAEDLISNVDRDRTIIYGLVYDELDAEGMLKGIRNNDTDYDWTRYLPDIILNDMVKKFVEENEQLSKKFEELDIRIYDVSENREDVINMALLDAKEDTYYSSVVRGKKLVKQ